MSKVSKEKKVIDKSNSKNSWVYLLLLLICAIVAGIFGETIMRTFIAKDVYSPYSYYNEVNLGHLSATNPALVIRDAKKVVVNHDVKISETISTVESSLIRVFQKNEKTEATKLKKNVNKEIEGINEESTIDYSSYYNLEKPLLLGLLITTDGWAVASVEKDFDLTKEELVVIDSSKKVYEVSDILEVNNDGLVFFRLAGANNLPIRNNISKSDFFLGQSFLSFASLNSVQSLSLNSLTEKEVLSSDNFYLNLKLSKDESQLKNNFIFNLAGDLAIIVNSEAKLIPAFSYEYQWRSFLNDSVVEKPFFGVNYLDLKNIKMASDKINLSKGALLYSDGNLPAIIKGSPAEKAGLKEHDIIIWVNNKEVGVDGDLTEIIASYNVGDKLKISYMRNDEEYGVELVLENNIESKETPLLK